MSELSFFGGFLCGVLFELAVTGAVILVLNVLDKRHTKHDEKELEKRLMKQMEKGLRERR